MAVYTQVPSEALAQLLTRYDLGALRSAKGIAEGVQNTNYLLETDRTRLFLTLYETAIDPADLPFFLSLTRHLANGGLPVPCAYPDRDGIMVQTVMGRPACLIEFLDGVSVTVPTTIQAHATGAALGRMHRMLADFGETRPNPMGPDSWAAMAADMGQDADRIAPGLADRIRDELAWLDRHWPRHLPRAVVHGDLFPDNVLMIDDQVTGLIDFYFAGHEVRAWDVAVTHAAWAFSADGRRYDHRVGEAILAGYADQHPLTATERAAFSALARGACLRFLLTRCRDWLNTPPDALVERKDPLAFLRRLDHYSRDNGQPLAMA